MIIMTLNCILYRFHLGFILKSETKTEEMVSICEDLQGYVPTISTEYAVEVPGESEEYQVTADNFHYVLLGMVIEAGVL